MQEIINKAIAHITNQMMQNQDDSAIVAIEEYLTDICKNEVIASKLLNEEKTLKGALKAIENRARKIQKNNRACIGPWEEIIREGKNQHHCVGSYVDKVADRNSNIFFIRKAGEIDKACHGYLCELYRNWGVKYRRL